MSDTNDNLILVCGKSAVGKTSSLRNLANPAGVAYMNCEAGKKITFPAKFQQVTVTDPLQVPQSIEALTGNPKFHTIVIDSLSFLMQMYEQVYVNNSPNTQKSWGEYASYFINMMQQSVAKSDKNIIFLAHTGDTYNEADMVTETKAIVKGSLNKLGIESFFSTVVATKRIELKKLSPFIENNSLLNITPEDEALGWKYVYQCKLTKDTINERIRSPLGMWSQQETYIDADIQLVLNRLKEYYA